MQKMTLNWSDSEMPKNRKSPMSSSERAELDAEEIFRRRPDFFEKHLKGAPNLKAVAALFKKKK